MTEFIDEYQRVFDLYEELCDQEPRGVTLCGTCVQYRVSLVEKLENLLHTDFYDTTDLHQKVRAYLTNQNTPYIKLRKYRKEKGYSSRTMAEILSVSREHYSRMEAGRKPLNSKALEILYKKGMS